MKKVFLTLTLLCSFQARAGFFADLGATFTDAFDKDGLIILGVGAGLTALASTQDQAMHDAWVNNQRMNRSLSDIGNFWGQGWVEGGIAAGQLIWDRENGLAHTEALIASSAVVYALKYSTARPRPDSDTKTSFPSGHTQFSFASATSLSISYGWKVGVPMFAMAAFTGLSRLADNAHWLSDVVAGATVGVLFARSAHKHHLTVVPLALDNRGYGLQVTYRF